MTWAHWPQYFVLGGWSAAFVAHCAWCGRPFPQRKYNPLQHLLFVSLSATIMYFGGFFAAIGWAP